MPSWSPFSAYFSNPIIYVDSDGKHPILPLVLAALATDALLITAGIITTGFILHQASEGGLAVNSNIADYFHKDNPTWKEAQKRERASQKETTNIVIKHNDSMDKNVGQRTPDGDNNSTGGGSAFVNAVVVFGLAATVIESTLKHKDNNNANQPLFKSANAAKINSPKDNGTTVKPGNGSGGNNSNSSGNKSYNPLPKLPANTGDPTVPQIPLRNAQ